MRLDWKNLQCSITGYPFLSINLWLTGNTAELLYTAVKAAFVLSLPILLNCSLGYSDYILQTYIIVWRETFLSWQDKSQTWEFTDVRDAGAFTAACIELQW